jgi:hypothetical protein
MHLFWLTFETTRDTRVFIIEAAYMRMARIKASMAGQDGEFQNGIEIDANTAKKIPQKMIGRSLSREEAERLLSRVA